MRVDVDMKNLKLIPKSVLKIGVKLPEMARGTAGITPAKSTPDLTHVTMAGDKR